MDSVVYDVVVIGAGVNGCSAALHLARTGKKTILVEQFPLPNDRSSSGGQSRIFRYAHGSPDSFNPIVVDSHQKWLQLEKDTETSLFRKQYAYFHCKKSDQKELKVLAASIVKNGYTPIIQSIEEFNAEFKTTFDDDKIVLVDTTAGVLMAAKCLQAMQDLFVRYGGTILDEFPVADITVLKNKNDHVLIKGEKGRNVEAKSAVICAGPWTNRLLHPLGLTIPLEPIRVSVLYWALLDKSCKTFTFVDIHNITDVDVYGLPDIEYPGLIKIALHGGVPCDPNMRDFKGNEVYKERLCKYIKKNFPWLGPKPVIEESCMYTMSPDMEMIIDQHPIYKNISFACGFSGTGFKTGPIVGQILGELATGDKLSYDIADFKVDRFNNSSRISSTAKL